MDIEILTYLTVFSDILAIIEKDLKNKKDISNDKCTTALLCLYCTIYEDCFSCMVLIKKHLLTAVSNILRNMLEAYVDFINLNNDESYLSLLELDYHKHRLKIFKEGLFEGDFKVDDVKIDSIKAKISEIESRNGKALSIKTKFKRAGLENFYKGAYITLCGETHNNLAVLMDRSYNSERDVFMLVNERPIQAFVAHIETIFYIIAEATEVIYERMNISNDFLDIKIKQMKNYLSKNPFQS